jgi:hypothetical protein
MKIIDGQNYLKIGEVAKLLEKSAQTIKIWYEYAQENNVELPKYRTDLDARGTRYWKEIDVEKLKAFRDSITKGMMVGTTEKKWGETRVNKLNQKGARYGVEKYVNKQG